MSKQIFKQSIVDPMVKEIAQRETMPIIGYSIDQIADEIFTRTGVRPSKSVISASLYRIGAVSNGRKFVYKHKRSHE